MAYDKAKAHEYYLKYRKKGRKKGRKKKGSSTSLIGLSSAGLNDNGRIEASIIKDRIKKEMNTALAKASTQEEKDKIRAEYSKKAQEAINALKSDANYAKPKATKSGGGSKESTGKSSAGSTGASKATSTAKKASAVNVVEMRQIADTLNTLKRLIPMATGTQKEKLRNIMSTMLDKLRKNING